MHIERIDPHDLDLDTADAMAEVVRASDAAGGVPIPPVTGPTLLHAARHGWDGTPAGALWVLRDGDRVVEARCTPTCRGATTPTASTTAAWCTPTYGAAAVAAPCTTRCSRWPPRRAARRSTPGALQGTDGIPALAALGYEPVGTNAIRRISLHDAQPGLWDRLHAQAAAKAGDYELVRMVGPTPAEQLEDMVALFATINDAPSEDADKEDDHWTADRVAAYDTAMAARGRRSTG